MFFATPEAQAAVPRSVAEHTHQFAGHAACAPSHVARRVLLLTFIAPFTHSPALFTTFAFGLPSPQSFMVEVMLPIKLSTYALFTASRPATGAATFTMRLFAMSSVSRIVVVPFMSKSVAGVFVLIPIFPLLSLNNPLHAPPGVPEGGLAKVHAAKSADPTSMRIKTLFGIFVSIPYVTN